MRISCVCLHGVVPTCRLLQLLLSSGRLRMVGRRGLHWPRRRSYGTLTALCARARRTRARASQVPARRWRLAWIDDNRAAGRENGREKKERDVLPMLEDSADRTSVYRCGGGGGGGCGGGDRVSLWWWWW